MPDEMIVANGDRTLVFSEQEEEEVWHPKGYWLDKLTIRDDYIALGAGALFLAIGIGIIIRNEFFGEKVKKAEDINSNMNTNFRLGMFLPRLEAVSGESFEARDAFPRLKMVDTKNAQDLVPRIKAMTGGGKIINR